MDSLIIEKKLDSLQRCLNRIAEKCPATAEALEHDLDLQDVIVLNLSRAVQLCVDIGAHCLSTSSAPPPNTMGETFERLAQTGLIDNELAGKMKKSVGFRNLAVHNYSELNIQIVHAIASRHLKDFRQFALSIAQATATIDRPDQYS